MLLICFSNVIILAMEDGMLATYLSLPGRCLLPCTPQVNPVGELRALGWVIIVHCSSSEKGFEVFVFINELCFVETIIIGIPWKGYYCVNSWTPDRCGHWSKRQIN